MDQQKETIYKISGDTFLSQYEPKKEFYLKTDILTDENEVKKVWMPVTVLEVWVSSGPKYYEIHAKIDMVPDPVLLEYCITEKQYKKWMSYKGDRRRMGVLLAEAKGDLRLKKIVANKHVDIRMTDSLYRELFDGARKAKMSMSEYCRQQLEGKKPRAALSPDEFEAMMDLTRLRADIQRFSAATTGYLGQLPKEQRLQYIVEGQAMTWWREYIKRALNRIDRLINKEKDDHQD